MSITLLEFVVALVLIVVAWQIGIIIAPWILHQIRSLKQDIDDVASGQADGPAARHEDDQ